MIRTVPRAWFYALFTLSGFAGLIYESIWSHYLKLFLGHAAYAQTLVLAIFMGGMAIGSWLCSRYSGNWRNLLLGYAAAEAAIGICALLFHKVFVGATDLAYDSVMPALGSAAAVTAFKWGLCALLILPQSVLLGMTFPLMSAGLIRLYPAGSGGTIAMLYFTNSLGAAAGVLASGFVLVALVGLPGTMLTAGILNIVLALVVWLVARDMTMIPAAPRVRQARDKVRGRSLMLAVAALTGAASFIYEIGWIRMLSLVLGSSTHAFEIMLSAFILGLAFGGLWIKRRIDGIAEPERFLGIVQVAMGLCALATLVVYGGTFEIMHWLLGVLAHSEDGYALFNFGSHVIALLVMFPAAFCAGMTLPLITHCLLKREAGEGAIGAVYAANTVGAIAGVFAAVHVGLPLLGLKGLITAGAAIDIGLGLVLLRWVAARQVWMWATVAGVAGIAATLAFVQLDPYKMASGIYRRGAFLPRHNSEILFHHDGKTATVDLVRSPGRVSIHTNGKSDAAINLDPLGRRGPDEVTMVLTGALPLVVKPDARTAANIGFGSGLSSHVLLASDQIESLDTIEIESSMVDAARGFSPRNDNVYRDPRSHIHIEDAKTFFSTNNKRFDIISSEPSNPWVSGVASLFSEEFYRRVKRHLVPGGVFVQWMQVYEISPPLVASVFKALGREFSDYEVYAANDSDLVIVAKNGGSLPPLSPAIFAQQRVAAELAIVNIRNVGDLELHRVGNKKVLQPYFDSFPISANSEFFPVLDLNAAKARFMDARTIEIGNLAMMRVPAIEMLGGGSRQGVVTEGSRWWLRKSEFTQQALAVRAYLLEGRAGQLERIPAVVRSDLQLARLLAIDCASPRGLVSADQLYEIAAVLVPVLTREELRPVLDRIRNAPCAARMGDAQRNWLALVTAVGERDAKKMAELGESLLRQGSGRRDYLLGAAITGRLALGEGDRAAVLWREFAEGMVSSPSDPLPDFLRGHLGPNLAAPGHQTGPRSPK
jgi:spermidine synthase